MLAGGNRRSPRKSSGPCIIASLLLLGVALAMSAAVRADAPSVRFNNDASVTLDYGMNGTQGLALNGTVLGDGNASLPWDSATLAWTSARDFVSNESAASNLYASTSGLTLYSHPDNRIPDGNFSDSGSWIYTNGSGAPFRVNASWNADGGGAALLQHTSPSTEALWNSMDSISNWAWFSTTAIGQVYEETTGQVQGAGMLGMNITTHTGAFSANATWNLVPNPANNANWSAVDRLILWIKDNASLGLSFSLAAVNAKTSATMTTPAQPLGADWQEMDVDLNQLGPSASRENLSSVWLRISGPATVPANTWVFFDDVRVGVAKVFASSAAVSQEFDKGNASSALPGSAYLSFDWCLCNKSGVSSVSASFGLAGPGGSYAAGLPTPATPLWSRYVQDISPWTTVAGRYNLTFDFTVTANNTAESNATLWVDNATFLFPDVHNGTYLSAPIDLESDSQMVSAAWAATATSPPATVRVSLRSGNGSGAWNPWTMWTVPGSYPLTMGSGRYVQVGLNLNTTNASVLPVIESFSLSARHHPGSGIVVSDFAPVQGKFLRWRSLVAQVQLSASTLVSFAVGNGSYWTDVPANGSLLFYAGSSLKWQATLSTTDGVQTPSLALVSITYEYTGSPVAVVISPGGPVGLAPGGRVQFTAVALDPGNHAVTGTLFDWHTSDPSGQVTNGLYVAGQPGVWNVTAVAVGWGVSQTVQVRVASDTWAALWPPLAGVAALGVLAFVGYEVAIRRMFAIDDVFLISRDGRLIMHNTRRMRADRDEDILSGMLTAIMAFLRDQDPEEDGELKRFEVGGKTTFLERGDHVYLAAIYSGRVPGWAGKDLHRFITDLEDTFGDAFAKWTGSPEDLRGLKTFMQRFVSHVRYHGGSTPSREEG